MQATVKLRYFGGHSSYEEISATLGVPMGTVKSRLNAAKLRLAEALPQTAGLEHDETRRLAEARAKFFESAYAEYNRAEGYETLASSFSEDLVFSLSNGRVFARGYEFMIKDMERSRNRGQDAPDTGRLEQGCGGADVPSLGSFDNSPDDGASYGHFYAQPIPVGGNSRIDLSPAR